MSPISCRLNSRFSKRKMTTGEVLTMGERNWLHTSRFFIPCPRFFCFSKSRSRFIFPLFYDLVPTCATLTHLMIIMRHNHQLMFKLNQCFTLDWEKSIEKHFHKPMDCHGASKWHKRAVLSPQVYYFPWCHCSWERSGSRGLLFFANKFL